MKSHRNKNIVEIIFFTVIGFLIVTFNKISFCQQFYGLGFDSQAFLFWDHVNSLNLVPYKDFFYPYGLLFYLKAGEVGWFIASLVLVAIIILIIYLTFKAIFKDKKYLYTFYLSFCLFTLLFIDLDTFLRYSPLIVFAYLISYYAKENKLISIIPGLIIGLTLGLLFAFINDLFLYSVTTYVVFFVFYFFLNIKINKELTNQIALHFAAILGGFIIGIVPIAVYLYINSSINDFILHYLTLKDIYQLAKVPFPPSLRSLENSLIIASLIFSIFFLYIQLKKKTFNMRFYLILSLTILILFLEQKNLIRSFYTQISFFSFIIFLNLLDEFRLRFKNNINEKYIFIYTLNFIFLIFLMIVFDRNLNIVKSKNIFSGWNTSYCLSNKINKIDPSELKHYISVKDYLFKDEYVRVFSFPGDPIFYQLFNQKPPYYPSIYEATPIYAQQRLIRYIHDNNVNFVILNQKSESIQDGVPDKVRAKLLYSYIMNNFMFDKKLNNFAVYRKKK